MSNPAEKLKLAIAVEQDTHVKKALEFLLLGEKVKNYQLGVGPAPTDKELIRWREGAEYVVKTRALESGFGELS